MMWLCKIFQLLLAVFYRVFNVTLLTNNISF